MSTEQHKVYISLGKIIVIHVVHYTCLNLIIRYFPYHWNHRHHRHTHEHTLSQTASKPLIFPSHFNRMISDWMCEILYFLSCYTPSSEQRHKTIDAELYLFFFFYFFLLCKRNTISDKFICTANARILPDIKKLLFKILKCFWMFLCNNHISLTESKRALILFNDVSLRTRRALCHKLCIAIVGLPFWLSTEHLWRVLMPFWLSTDDVF